MNLRRILAVAAMVLCANAARANGWASGLGSGFVGSLGSGVGIGDPGYVNYGVGNSANDTGSTSSGSSFTANGDLYGESGPNGNSYDANSSEGTSQPSTTLYPPDYDGSSWVVSHVQAALTRRGYYHGRLSGVVGPFTSQAIAAYQQGERLPVTGTITYAVLISLNLE